MQTRVRTHCSISRLAAAALLFIAGLPSLSATGAAELRTMSAADIRALQQRLIDAHCYSGPADGAANEATQQAVKACPVMDPILSIETGMHTAVLRRVGVDRECRLLATGSEDKTVRLWSLPEGRLLKTLRPPIGAGDFGKVNAVAVSPDGRLVAAGGYDARWSSEQRVSVYLFDPVTGALKARAGDFEDVIEHLAFSPDGRFLAATLNGGQGLRVIDTERMREVAADHDYGVASYGAAFAPDGRLFTVAIDGYLRAYDADFRLVKKVQTRGGRQLFSVAVDPAGERVAVGYEDSQAVEVYKASDLSLAFAADTAGINDRLGRVAWSSDGRRLLAGGFFRRRGSNGEWRMPVIIWDRGGQGARHEQPVALDTIQHVMPCGAGFAVGASDPMFALLDPGGTPRLTKTGVAADMRSKLGEALQVSGDGRQVRFGLGAGGASPVLFDLAGATLSRDATVPGLAVARIAGIAVTDWNNRTAPKLAGKELKLKELEWSYSLAIGPNADRFVIGADWSLRAYDAQGQEQWNKPVPGVAWGVNVTGDGRLVLAAYGDGTIRWHRISDGQELLALFVNKADLRWVAWTPSGYYMASPGGEDLIGWHVNRGWEQAADFFPASRFRERFSRPDVVQKVLDTGDEDRAVKLANAEAGRREETKPLLQRLPPVIRITSPGDSTRFSGASVDIGYALRSPSGLPVDRVDVLIDGRQVETRAPARFEGRGEEQRSVSVPVPARDVEIALIARSGDLIGEAARLRLAYAGAAPADPLKSKLYALVIGVSDYADASLKLGFAAKDARDFAHALQTLKGGIYGDVTVRLATDREVTRLRVVDDLEWLEKEVTSRDIGLVFVAGHGVTDDKHNYWFLPADATPERLRSSGVSQDDLRRTLQALAGKALFFLDTCHAGQAFADGATRRGVERVDINSVVNEFTSAENGVVTFASSQGRELALERPEWGNGAFTKAIIEGLFEGRADFLRKGTITLSQLDAYVANRVKDLTGGAQHPIMIRPSTVPDFPIAVVVGK